MTAPVTLFDVSIGDADFSACRSWRYRLNRRWDSGRGLMNCVMLNPSTASEIVNDPTVTRCIARARNLGKAGLIVTNLFAWRSTDPAALTKVADPVGPDNDRAILTAAGDADLVLCAWGNDGAIQGRAAQVLSRLLLAGHGEKPHHLGLTNEVQPRHPLYVSYAVAPVPWRFGTEVRP